MSKQQYTDPNFRWVISVHVGVRMCLCELEYLCFFVAFKLLTFPTERCDGEGFWHFLAHSTIWLEAHHSLGFSWGCGRGWWPFMYILSEARKIQWDETFFYTWKILNAFMSRYLTQFRPASKMAIAGLLLEHSGKSGNCWNWSVAMENQHKCGENRYIYYWKTNGLNRGENQAIRY